jgi:hypothetical protein
MVLTILKCGGLFIQSFKDSSRGRPLWALSGTCTVDAEFVREWAETLFLMTRLEPIEKRQQDVDFQRKRYGEWVLSGKEAGERRC